MQGASVEGQENARHRARVEEWLGQKRPLRLSKVHVLLSRDYGLDASYATLRRFAMEELGWRKKTPTVLVADDKPGGEAQIDFGLMGMLADADGKLRRVWAPLATPVISRYQFVWPSFVQTTEAVCEGLDAAWRFFEAMPRVLVPDNMSSIVSVADPMAPRIVDAFEDYLQARGSFVDTARVRAPRDKGRVENQVAYVRERWFDGESFLSLADTRTRAEAWCHAGLLAREKRHGRIVRKDL